MNIVIRHGLPLPVAGALPDGEFVPTRVPRIGLAGADYSGIRAEILVEAGQAVASGSPLFQDRKRTEIVITSPVSGRIEKIEIGPQRRLSLLTILAEGEDAVRFELAATGTPAGVGPLPRGAELHFTLTGGLEVTTRVVE